MSRSRAVQLFSITVGALLLAVAGCERLATETERPSSPLEPQFDSGPGEHSHMRYLSLNWHPTGAPGEVEFTLIGAFRRNSVGNPVTGDVFTESGGPTQFNFGDGSSVTPTLQFLATGHDTSHPNPDQHWVIGVALDPNTGEPGIRHEYSGTGPFVAYLAGFSTFPPGGTACCRIGQFGLVQLNNRSGAPYPVQTEVAPMSGNSSPVTGLAPIIFVGEGSDVTFGVPASDPDGDPIRWRMSTDLEAGGPSHPPNMSIDPSTGIVTWNNVGLDKIGLWTAQVVVEDLDGSGNVKSTAPVDFLLQIVDGDPPVFIAPTPPDGTVFQVQVDNTLMFDVAAQDPDQDRQVSLNHGGLPSGATFPLPSPANSVQSTFTWTPTNGQVGSHVVTFFATNDLGLGSEPRSYTIEVLPQQNFAEETIDEDGGTVVINDEEGDPIAGLDIPAGALDDDVTFTIQLFDLDDPECTSPAALLIDAIGQCLSIQTDPPGITLNEPATVGICLDVPFDVDDEDVHVYRVSNGDDPVIQRLENVPAPFLVCDPAFSAMNGSSGLWGYARALFERTTRWLQPEPLYATRRIALIDRGFGGHTDIFSEFLWGLPGVVINPSTINCRNDNGMITVAILGREEFDVEDVDHTTVTFEGASEIHVDGRTGEPRLHLEDVNGDGLMDMVFHFRFGDTGLTCESTSGQIQGELTDETKFMGSDLIRMNEPRGQRP